MNNIKKSKVNKKNRIAKLILRLFMFKADLTIFLDFYIAY